MTTVRLALALAFTSLAASAWAQDTPPAIAREKAATSSAPTVERTRSDQPRALSPALSAALAERMPKYAPPPPPREPTEEEIAASQPKNGIVRLPRVVVEGQRPPVFTDRQLHTDRGMAELAMRRYLSELDRGVLNKYTLPLFGQSNEARALAAYAEEERLRHMRTNAERADLIEASEGADAAADFRDLTNATFIRSPYLPEPSSLRRD